MKFKHSFPVPSKDFKRFEHKSLWVETTDNLEHINDVYFRVKIPDYMFDELADSTPKYKTTHDFNNHELVGCYDDRTISRKFKKTQSAVLLSTLKDFFSEMTNEIIERHNPPHEDIKKKIFIIYNYDNIHKRCDYNAAYMGKRVSSSFQFFIGYEITHKDEYINKGMMSEEKVVYKTKIEYHPKGSSTAKLDTNFHESDDTWISLSGRMKNEDWARNFSIIDWTQEKEDFCVLIREKFDAINAELAKFLTNIDDEKFKLLMDNNLKMLGN